MGTMRETEKEERKKKESRKRVLAESQERRAFPVREWSIEPNPTKQHLHHQKPVLPRDSLTLSTPHHDSSLSVSKSSIFL